MGGRRGMDGGEGEVGGLGGSGGSSAGRLVDGDCVAPLGLGCNKGEGELRLLSRGFRPWLGPCAAPRLERGVRVGVPEKDPGTAVPGSCTCGHTGAPGVAWGTRTGARTPRLTRLELDCTGETPVPP